MYERIFKWKVNSNMKKDIYDYHRLLFYSWKKEVESLKRKKIPKPNREERDYNS